mgnify:CR=1 FL=1
MLLHTVKVYPSKINLPKKKQLAWKIAEIASDNSKLNKDSIEMVINRIIDNASVAIASLNRKPVISSREMALKHSRKNGASLFGVNSKLKFDCEWAAWSNGTAVRELDFHDTFLAADYSHPGDNIPPLLAVAQQNNKNGLDLLRKYLNEIILNSDNSTIYIIDNNSSDESVLYVRNNYTEVKVISLDKNYGFAEGYNIGLKEVEEEYVCIINNDILVTENWLDPIRKKIKKQKIF